MKESGRRTSADSARRHSWPKRPLKRCEASPQAMRSEPSRCTRPYGAPRDPAKRAEKRDPCLSIALRRYEFRCTPQRDAKRAPQAMRSEPSRCTRPYGAPRDPAKRAEKRDPCLSIALRRCEFRCTPQRDAKRAPQAMRSEPSRCTRPYGAPRDPVKRAEKRDPCLSIALRRCEFGSRPLFSPDPEGVSPHPARLLCLLSWQDKKVGRPPQGGETAFDFKPLSL